MKDDDYSAAIDREVERLLSGCKVATLIEVGDQLRQLSGELQDLIKDRFQQARDLLRQRK